MPYQDNGNLLAPLVTSITGSRSWMLRAGSRVIDRSWKQKALNLHVKNHQELMELAAAALESC